MKIKRPFSDDEFQATPEPVRLYIVQLEGIVSKLLSETEDLKKRVAKLENSANLNSQNSSKPSSTDSPFKKPLKGKKKSKLKQGGQKGHKGHKQKLIEPTSEEIILPEKCDCGCSSFTPESIKPFYTHQVIELPQIKMNVLHFILNKGKCKRCGNIVKAEIPKKNRTGYGPRLSALIAETSGIQGNSRETVRTFCQSVLGFSISLGAIQNVIDRV